MASAHLDRLEALVTGAARSADLLYMTTTRDGEVSATLRLVRRAADPGLRSARLWATGGEAYGLDLSDGFRTVDFAYDEADELEVLHQLVAVARECLLGHDEVVEQPLTRGRRRYHLEVVVEGKAHRLSGPVFRDPDRPWRRWLGLRR